MDIPLRALIEQARDQLRALKKDEDQKDTEPLLNVTKVVVEVNVVAETSDTAKGGFDLKVISAGADTSYSEQQVHKITVELATFPQNAIALRALGLKYEYDERS